jgi:CRP/FNR family transcriptional regulator, cyclic AMP receptor protein
MSERTSLWYFEEVDLYNVLCPHKIPGMKERHIFNHFQKDQFIYFPNEPSSHIYLIAEGRVKIGSYTEDGKEILKAILGAGEIFGELSIAGEERRTDFAQALDPNTTVCPMTIDDMQELMKENQALSLRIFKLMGLRLKRVERKLESLVFKDARSRVIDFIREMAEERGQKVGYEMLIKTKFTHKDIASLTGTSRQTVTTILNELKSQNVINFDRRRILVRDMDKLK